MQILGYYQKCNVGPTSTRPRNEKRNVLFKSGVCTLSITSCRKYNSLKSKLNIGIKTLYMQMDVEAYNSLKSKLNIICAL